MPLQPFAVESLTPTNCVGTVIDTCPQNRKSAFCAAENSPVPAMVSPPFVAAVKDTPLVSISVLVLVVHPSAVIEAASVRAF